MKNSKKIILKALCCAAAVFCFMLQGDNVFATTYHGNTLNKAHIEGIYTCNNAGRIRTGRESGLPQITVESFPLFATNPVNYASRWNGDNPSFLINENSRDDIVLLPSGLDDITNSDLTCNELFVGYSGLSQNFQGLLKVANVTQPGLSATSGTKKDFLENLGYVGEEAASGDSGSCQALKATKTHSVGSVSSSSTTTEVKSYALCLKSNGDWLIKQNGGDGFLDFSLVDSNNTLRVSYKHRVRSFDPSSRTYEENNAEGSNDFTLSNYSTVEGVLQDVANSLINLNLGFCNSYGGDGGTATVCEKYQIHATNKFTEPEPLSDVTTIYKLQSIDTMASYFSSGSYADYASLEFTDSQKIALYQDYITYFYEAEFYDSSCPEYNNADKESIRLLGYTDLYWIVSSTKKLCFVKTTKPDETVNIVKNDNHFGEKLSSGGGKTAFEKIVDLLNDLIGALPESEYHSVDENRVTTEGNSLCEQAGSSLGYILCPVIELVAKATTRLYVNAVEPLLKTNPNLLSMENSSDLNHATENNGAFTAWSIFQNFANIALVIILLVIIFSQLTGVGIDNYGIKKMLPRLIVAAILINLSFIICQLAVDLSNILGFSLRQIFDTMASSASAARTASVTSNASDMMRESGVAADSAIVGTGILAVVGSVAAIWIGGWAVLLALLPAIVGGLITAFVAVLFLFALLGFWQAGVVLLVVLAPIAIVCYILPNTQKFFNRWLKLFTALLLIYPITGLLMGAGAFGTVILLEVGDGGFWYTLAAMLVGVIPFFLIPSLLKGSFALMGNLGAKISGIGSRVGGRLSGGAKRASNNAINSSDRVQTARAEHARNRQTRSAQRMIDRVNAKGDRATAQDRLRAARAQQVLNRQTSEDIEAEVGVSPLDRGVLLSQAQLKRENADIEATESNIMNSDHADDFVALQRGLETAILSDDTVGIRAYQNVLSRKGEDGRQAVHNAMANAETTARNNGTTVSDAARRAYSSNLMNKWAGDYKNYSRSTFAYASRNTGATANGTIESYQASVVSGLKQEQMATMDGAELQRYADRLQSGTMSAEDSASLQRLAYDTLHNAQLQGSIKGSQRTILESMAQGYTPPAPAPAPAPSPSPAPAPAPSSAPAPPRPRLETFESESAADAAFNEELRRQRNNEKNRGKGGSGIILP